MFIKITSTISSIDDENLANVQFLTFMRVETPEKIQLVKPDYNCEKNEVGKQIELRKITDAIPCH